MPELDWLVWALAAATALGVPLYAGLARGRSFATFGTVILGISLPGALVTHVRLRDWAPPDVRPSVDLAFAYLIAAAGLHLAGLVRARLRSPSFRCGVSIPGMAFVAAGALAGVWLLALLPLRAALELAHLGRGLALLRWLDVVPFAVAALSVVTSIRPVHETVHVPVGGDGPEDFARLPVERRRHRWPSHRPRPRATLSAGEPRARLRIVQVADPHLGPWQPVESLRRRLEALLNHEPDLVLLTGDFLTMEGSGTPGALALALAPLRSAAGRCFAIFGNHDHEAPDEVCSALAANGVALLVDDEAVVQTPVGPVQILGADFVSRGRRAHLDALLARFPRRAGHLRLLLLHDPSAFRHLPKGAVDLTLSGHTHGGQLGLVSFGLDWTVLARTAWPDHGLFGHGPNRLYVHRGTGFYGFPLRIGVPGEASVLEVEPAGATRGGAATPR